MATDRDMQQPPTDNWHATWEDNRQSLLDLTLAATPAQRLAWLEDALELAYQASALPPRSTSAQDH